MAWERHFKQAVEYQRRTLYNQLLKHQEAQTNRLTAFHKAEMFALEQERRHRHAVFSVGTGCGRGGQTSRDVMP
jgi:hypothetical protein